MPFFKVKKLENISDDKFELQKYDEQMKIIEEFIHKNKISDRINHYVLIPEDEEFILNTKRFQFVKRNSTSIQEIDAETDNLKFKIVPSYKLSQKDIIRFKNISLENEEINDHEIKLMFIGIADEFDKEYVKEFLISPFQENDANVIEQFIVESNIIRQVQIGRRDKFENTKL